MSIKTKTIIIGAGAAGLFTASELYKLGHRDIIVLETGRELHARKCPNVIRCSQCSRCHVLFGTGGAGMFSDGKLNFSSHIGGSIKSILDENRYREYSNYLLNEYKFMLARPDTNRYKAVWSKHHNVPARFELVNQAHMGSDKLPAFIDSLCKDIGVHIKNDIEVKALECVNGHYKVETATQTYCCDNLVVATGQAGAEFALQLAEHFGLRRRANPADIGVRVEMRAELWEELISIQYDPKIYFDTNYGQVRTFCTNPGGYVIVENKKGMLTCNGHAMKNQRSSNTNFALMYRTNVVQPRSYIDHLCHAINKNNGETLVLQTAADFVASRSTKALGATMPTCNNYNLGNIAVFYPAIVYNAIRETLYYIGNMVPDFFATGSLVYAPEAKLYTDAIELVNEGFESKMGNLYFVGDCSGVIHGLTNAMLSGIACARHIVAIKDKQAG